MLQRILFNVAGLTILSSYSHSYALTSAPISPPTANPIPTQIGQHTIQYGNPLPQSESTSAAPEPSAAVTSEIDCEAEPLPVYVPDLTNVYIKTVQVYCNTVFTPEDFDRVTQQFWGQTVARERLNEIAGAVTQLYIAENYITSRAQVVGLTPDGTLQIQAIEGRLAEEIEIEGNQRLNSAYIRQRIRRGIGEPLQFDRLEDQLRLLRNDPLFDDIEASINASGEDGVSVLRVEVDEANFLQGNFGIDNYSPPSVGSERLTAAVELRNLTGIGDRLFGFYARSTTGGIDLLDLSYVAPLNALDGTVQLRGVFDRNEVTQPPFEELNIEGESEFYQITVRQPLIRTLREEFALSLGFDYKDGQTFLFDRTPTPFVEGADANGVSRTSVVRLGQEYIRYNRTGAWALRSQFSLGTGLFDATINSEPTPDSRFLSWFGQIQRVQRFGENNALIAQADLQITPDSLLPSEQFVIGGGQSLRGYSQNIRSGDNGFRISIEDRIVLIRDDENEPTLQLAPFIDFGSVWNHPNNPNGLPDQQFLIGTGIGALWEIVPNLDIRLDYAIPLVDLDDRGDNAQDEGFYFRINYQL